MKRGSYVILGTIGTLAAGLCGYGVVKKMDSDAVQDPDHRQICVDEDTMRRLEDDECRDGGSGGGHWFYVNSAHGTPAVGGTAQAAHGSFTRPTTGTISTVSRAGFGARSVSGGAGS